MKVILRFSKFKENNNVFKSFSFNERSIVRVMTLITLLLSSVLAHSASSNYSVLNQQDKIHTRIITLDKGSLRSLHQGTHSLKSIHIKENQSLKAGDDIATVMVLKYGSQEDRTVYLNENKSLLLVLDKQIEEFKKTKSLSDANKVKDTYRLLDSLKLKYTELEEYIVKYNGHPSVVTNIRLEEGNAIKRGDIIAETFSMGVKLPKENIDEEYYRSKLDAYDVMVYISGENLSKQEVNISELLRNRDTSKIWSSYGKPSVGDLVITLDKGDITFLDNLVEVEIFLKKK